MVLHCGSERGRKEKEGCGDGCNAFWPRCLFEGWGRIFIPSDLIWTRPHERLLPPINADHPPALCFFLVFVFEQQRQQAQAFQSLFHSTFMSVYPESARVVCRSVFRFVHNGGGQDRIEYAEVHV